MDKRHEEAALYVAKRMRVMEDYFQTKKTAWDMDLQYYNSIPTAKRPGQSPYDANIFVPVTREIVEAIQPRMAGDFISTDKPFINVVGRFYEDVDKAEAVTQWLFFRFQTMRFFGEYLPFVKQALIYGTSVGMVVPDMRFLYKKRPDTEINWDRFIAIDLYNYRVDPGATGPYDIMDEGVYSYCRIEDLNMYSDYYKNLDEVKPYAVMDFQVAQEKKDDKTLEDMGREVQKFDWWGPYKNEKGEEVLTCITMANGVCVKIQEDPFKTRRSPFVVARYEEDPFEFYGVGIPRALMELQTNLNYVRNLRINTLNRYISPMLIVRKSAVLNWQRLKRWEPFGLIEVQTGEPIGNVIMPLYPANGNAISAGLMEENQIREDIQRRAAVPDFTRGFGGNGRTTATEVAEQATGASTQFIYNFQKMTEESLVEISKLVLEHDVQRMKATEAVNNTVFQHTFRIMNEGKAAELMTITPDSIEGQYDMFATVDPHEAHKNLDRDILSRAIPPLLQMDDKLNMVGMSVQWPGIVEKFGKKFDLDTGTPLVMPMASLPGAMPGEGVPQEGQAPPGGDIGNVADESRLMGRLNAKERNVQGT